MANEVLVAYVRKTGGNNVLECFRASWGTVEKLPRNLKFVLLKVFHDQSNGTNTVSFDSADGKMLCMSGTAQGVHIMRYDPPSAHKDWSFNATMPGDQELQRAVDSKIADAEAAGAHSHLHPFDSSDPDYETLKADAEAVDPLTCPYV